ncbi:MAG TPA: lysozyme inhibitor LprI family protein, partial [Pseudolabrys sp.]
ALSIGGAVIAHAEDAPKSDASKPDAAATITPKDLSDDCDGGTAQIVECIGKLTEEQDRRLNKAYRETLKDVRSEQRDLLKTAQRLWVKYRDANCEYYHQGEGSISRIEAEQCMYRMTKSRADELDGGEDQAK